MKRGPKSRWTDDDLRKMGELLSSGMSQTEVARYFGTTQQTVSRLAPKIELATADARKHVTWDEMRHDPELFMRDLSPLDRLQLMQGVWDSGGHDVLLSAYRKART